MYMYVPYLKSSFLSDIDTPALRNFAISHECLNAAMGFGIWGIFILSESEGEEDTCTAPTLEVASPLDTIQRHCHHESPKYLCEA